jgi:hypothetical protein
MARYYFHIWTGDDYDLDTIGLDLASSDLAYVEAHRAVEEICCTMIMAHQRPAQYRLDVTDATGVKIFDLPFAEVLGVHPERAAGSEVSIANRARVRSLMAGLRAELACSRTIMQDSRDVLALSREHRLDEGRRSPGRNPHRGRGRWLRGRVRGLYRYETGSGRWWACVEDDDAKRVNFIRVRYELAKIQPPFLALPVESDRRNRHCKTAA